MRDPIERLAELKRDHERVEAYKAEWHDPATPTIAAKFDALTDDALRAAVLPIARELMSLTKRTRGVTGDRAAAFLAQEAHFFGTQILDLIGQSEAGARLTEDEAGAQRPAMTLTEFLLARITDDEILAADYFEDDGCPGTWSAWLSADREAKRRIVEEYQAYRAQAADYASVATYAHVVRLLALPYAQHPDYPDNRRELTPSPPMKPERPNHGPDCIGPEDVPRLVAQALRDAADEAEAIHEIAWTHSGDVTPEQARRYHHSDLQQVVASTDKPCLTWVSQWLRDRADRIESEVAQ